MPVALMEATAISATSFLQDVVSAVGSIIEMFGLIISALLSEGGALAPLFPFVAIGLGFALFYGGIRLVKMFVPGF